MTTATLKQNPEVASDGDHQVGYCALVVDDEPAIRQLTTRALAREGFRCDAAMSVQDARQWLALTSYDVVISDLRMPGEKGHRLALEVLKMPDRPAMVNITAVAEPRIEAFLKRHGVDRIFFKPIDYLEFAEQIKCLVERRRSRVPSTQQRNDSEREANSRVNGEPEVTMTADAGDADGAENAQVSRRIGANSSNPTTTNHGRPRARESDPPSTARTSPPVGRDGRRAIAHTLELDRPVIQKQPSVAGSPRARHAAYRDVDPSAKGPTHRQQSPRSRADNRFLTVAVCLTVILTLSHVVAHLRQQGVVTALEALGGRLATSVDGGMQVEFHGESPALVFQLLGKVPNVRCIDVSDSNLRDGDLVHLVSMRGLKELNVSSTRLSDRGVAQLAKIASLHELDLRDTNVTNAGVEELLVERPGLVVLHNSQ